MGSRQAFLLPLFGLAVVSGLTELSGTVHPAPVPSIRTELIGTPLKHSNVPPSGKQGVFLHPQSISAVDINADGEWVGITTMAFRHDRNFWLLGEEGKVQWGRYVQPWAPFQVALLSPLRSPSPPEHESGVRGAFAVGLAYSRFTDPSPTIALFHGEKSTETALMDTLWDLGWLRYGHDDWRTGWPASLIGDLIVRTQDSLLTVFSHDGAWRMTRDGSRKYPLLDRRPFRMVASDDGQVLAFGYLVPDMNRLEEKTRQRLRRPPALLTVSHALTSERLWTATPMKDAKPVMQPPEPATEFPALAEDFNMKPLTMVPFRVAVSLALDGDGSKAALLEYGGWLRLKRERGIGGWNPDHPVPFCPRQRGWVRVFGKRGQELVRTELPSEGLFEVHLNRQGTALWCAPLSWFARGLAASGCSLDGGHLAGARHLRWCPGGSRQLRLWQHDRVPGRHGL